MDDAGEMKSYTIPDPDGLIRAVTFSRLLHSRKLNGADIKWLRKATGSKQKDVARAISMSPEHLSRCESGALVMSAASEKLLRFYLFRSASRLHKMKECEEKDKMEALVRQLFDDHETNSVHDVEDELVFHFCRRPCPGNAGNDNDDGWDDAKVAAS
jgi:DNA-binding transcriptional regulator YiaG